MDVEPTNLRFEALAGSIPEYGAGFTSFPSITPIRDSFYTPAARPLLPF